MQAASAASLSNLEAPPNVNAAETAQTYEMSKVPTKNDHRRSSR